MAHPASIDEMASAESARGPLASEGDRLGIGASRRARVGRVRMTRAIETIPAASLFMEKNKQKVARVGPVLPEADCSETCSLDARSSGGPAGLNEMKR